MVKDKSSVVLRVYVKFWNTVENKVKLLLFAKMVVKALNDPTNKNPTWLCQSIHSAAKQFYEPSHENHLHLPLPLHLHSKQD